PLHRLTPPSPTRRSSDLNAVFGPALERDDRVLLVALANGRFPIGHALIDLSGIISHLLVLGGFRDQGLGAALIDEGEKVLREAGDRKSTRLNSSHQIISY